MINAQIYRPAWIPALVTAMLLMVALGLLVAMSWRSLARLQPVHTHAAQLARLQQASRSLEDVLLDAVGGVAPLDRARLTALASELETLPALDSGSAAKASLRLRAASRSEASEQQALSAARNALRAVRQTLNMEIRAHDELIKSIDRDTRVELQVASALFVGFPLLGLLVLYLLRHRILNPLRNLGLLLGLLAEREYSPAPAANVDAMLRPLFESYNALVQRLLVLERQHREREHTLEREVRAATETLLDQSRVLARSERLAAVGEVAAGLAHELRNPLAGIQLACGKLRRQATDPGQAQRLDLVNGEINRLTRLLNDLLSQVREAPEPASDIQLESTLTDLLSLARFQVPARIRLVSQIPQALHCCLPESHLRQALLNLVLNAAQALGESTGTVTLEARLDADALRISVCDDGPGFPEEVLRGGVRAFATWREHGTGLGLAMVRRFVRDLGGDLELTNVQPRGACATLRFAPGVAHV